MYNAYVSMLLKVTCKFLKEVLMHKSLVKTILTASAVKSGVCDCYAWVSDSIPGSDEIFA